MLPPPVSHLLEEGAGSRPSRPGGGTLRACKTPLLTGHAQSLTSRERILCALTDDAYA